MKKNGAAKLSQMEKSRASNENTNVGLPKGRFLPPITGGRFGGSSAHNNTHARSTSPEAAALSSLLIAPEEAIKWSLPETSKNFSKALKKSIQAKLDAARQSDEVHNVLQRRCRVIIHERVLARGGPLLLDAHANEGDAHQFATGAVDRSVSPATAEQRHQSLMAQKEKEVEKAHAARFKRTLAEQLYFERLTRSCDDPSSVDALLQRRQQWKALCVAAFLYLRNVVADAGGDGSPGQGVPTSSRRHKPVVRHHQQQIAYEARAYWRLRPVESLPPPSSVIDVDAQPHQVEQQQQQHSAAVNPRAGQQRHAANATQLRRAAGATQSIARPSDAPLGDISSLRGGSESPTAGPSSSPSPVTSSRRRGWSLYRASVVLKWACKVARKNVAVDRIVNMIHGAQRMAKFHRAMGVFRRKLLLCQRVVRDHIALNQARQLIFEKSFENATVWVKEFLLDHFDAAKRCRKAIAKAQEDAAAAARHAERVGIAEAAAAAAETERQQKLLLPDVSNAIVPAAAFLLAENSFMFAQNFMSNSADNDGPDWLHRNTSNGSVDLSFDDSGGMSMPRLRRSQSIVADDAVWRPLEFKRKQSVVVVEAANTKQTATSPALSSPIDSGGVGSGAASHASSPTSPTLSRVGGDTFAPKLDIVKLLLDGSIPEQRTENLIRRLVAHLHDVNQLQNDAYVTAMNVFSFDRAEYLQKRQAGKSMGLPVPRQPRPRMRSAVAPAHLVRALLLAEWEEHIMRSIAMTMAAAAVTSPTASLRSPTTQVPPTAPPPPPNIPFPAQLEEHKLSILRFRHEARLITKRKRDIAAETRRREELAREVEPVQFPAVSRRDTVRLLVVPKSGD